MGDVAHSKEVLAIANYSGLDVLCRFAGVCSEFGFGTLHLYDLLTQMEHNLAGNCQV